MKNEEFFIYLRKIIKQTSYEQNTFRLVVYVQA